MSDPLGGLLHAMVRRHRTMAIARWIAVLFGVFQVAAYETLDYPAGLQGAAYATVAVLALGNVVFEVLRRRVADLRDAQRLAVAAIVLDTLVASALNWVFAFDPVSALFAILIIVPIEAALYFQLRGAIITWAAVSALYAGREWFGTRYDNPWEWSSLTFRVGLIGLVAYAVGAITRDLVLQQRATNAALEELRHVDGWRRRMLAMLAHDVRAPLGTIHMTLETLLQAGDRLDAARAEQLARSGLRQTDRALLLARDLLDMARVDEGSLRLAVEPTSVAQAVDEVVTLLPGGGRGLVGDIAPDVVADADPRRLEQVLFNLLDNAMKHGDPPVEVSASTSEGEVAISVRDHGAGVDDAVALFEPFGGSGGESSVGLGVWTAKQLVEAHGGRLEHRPADPGAEFVAVFPRASSARKPAATSVVSAESAAGQPANR